MNAVNKIALLTTLHDKVDLHIQEATRTFQNLPTERLLRQPGLGSWSAAQCFAHLNQYGDYYLPQIQLVLAKAGLLDGNEMFRSGWLGSYFIKIMDPETGTTKIKTFKEYIPSPALDPHAEVAGFIHQQETMLKYLEQAKGGYLNRRLPISLTKLVRLKLGDVFQFLVAHNARHLAQATRAVQ